MKRQEHTTKPFIQRIYAIAKAAGITAPMSGACSLQIAKCFDSLGMDIEKPFSVSYVEMEKENKMLYMACYYVAF